MVPGVMNELEGIVKAGDGEVLNDHTHTWKSVNIDLQSKINTSLFAYCRWESHLKCLIIVNVLLFASTRATCKPALSRRCEYIYWVIKWYVCVFLLFSWSIPVALSVLLSFNWAYRQTPYTISSSGISFSFTHLLFFSAWLCLHALILIWS